MMPGYHLEHRAVGVDLVRRDGSPRASDRFIGRMPRRLTISYGSEPRPSRGEALPIARRCRPRNVCLCRGASLRVRTLVGHVILANRSEARDSEGYAWWAILGSNQ